MSGSKVRCGTYHGAGRELSLCRSDTKFDSRTGGPGFWTPMKAP